MTVAINNVNANCYKGYEALQRQHESGAQRRNNTKRCLCRLPIVS